MIGHARRVDEADATLYAAFRDRGEETALAAIVERHWASCYGVARMLLGDPAAAEDAAQQALIRLVAAARTRRRIESPGGWLRSATVTEARNLRRSEQRRTAHHAARTPAQTGPEDPVASVREHVAALPEKLREPIVLHYGLGLTHAEIGETLGAPASTVSSWISNGIERLRAATTPRAALGLEALIAAGLGIEAMAPAPPTTRSLLERAPRPRLWLRPGLLALPAAGVATAAMLALVLPRLLAPDATPDAPLRAHVVAPLPTDTSTPTRTPSVAEPLAPIADAPGTTSSTAASSSGGETARRSVVGRIVDRKGVPVRGARVALSRSRRKPNLPGAWTHDDDAAAAILAAAPLEDGLEIVDAAYYSRVIEPLGDTTSNEDGTFRFPLPANVARQDGIRLCAGIDLPGGRAVGGQSVEVTRATELDAGDVTVVLPALVPVLVAAAGLPPSNALVTIETSSHGAELRFSYLTDGGGRVAVPVLPGCEALQIRAAKAGFATQVRRSLAPRGDGVVAFDLAPEAVVRGVVVDDRRGPVASLRIEAHDPGDRNGHPFIESSWTRTDSEGRFVLGGLAAGASYEIEVDVPRSDPTRWGAWTDLTAPANDVVLHLRQAAALEVDLLLPEGFVPGEDWRDSFSIQIEHERGTSSHDGVALVAPRRARSTLRLWAEPYQIAYVDIGEPTRPRLAPVISENIVPADETVTHVEFVTRLGRTISGRVVDALHARVPKPEICFSVPGCGMCFEGEEDGRFELGGFPPETFELEVSHGDGHGTFKVTVPAGASDLGEIVLPAR